MVRGEGLRITRQYTIRKAQARWVSAADVGQQNRFIDKLFDLAA